MFSVWSAPRLYNEDPKPAESLLHKGYDRKGSVHGLVAWRQDELIGGKPSVVV
jgi:hypothetical protein